MYIRLNQRDEDPTFFSTDRIWLSRQKKNLDPTLILNEEKKFIYIYIR